MTAPMLRADVPVALLDDHQDNPNEMTDRQFDLLVDNMKRRFTDPIYCVPIDLTDFQARMKKAKNKEDLFAGMVTDDRHFRIVGGHHRKRAAIYLHLETVPCTIDLDPDFDMDEQEVQMVRHNIIHGKMDPVKFLKLYNKHAPKHGPEMMADVFGFSDEAELKKLIAQTEKSLPDNMKKAFKEAAEEIKSVDDLTKLLNHLFTKFGDTLPFGFMLLDYGGKNSIWLRVGKQTYEAALVVGEMCVKEQRTMDEIFGKVVQMIAQGKLKEAWESAVEQTAKAKIPLTFTAPPNLENLEKAGIDLESAE